MITDIFSTQKALNKTLNSLKKRDFGGSVFSVSSVVIKSITILILIWTSGWAGTGGISGVVRDRTTKQPLVGANVIVSGTDLGAATDKNGYFLILRVPMGQYSVLASYIGYRSITKTRVTILSKRTVVVDFELEEDVIPISGIIVRPDYFPKERSQATSSAELDFHEVRSDPEGYNLPRMLSSLPGVATAEDHSSTIIVRGGSPDENLTIVDNIEVPYSSHFPDLGGGAGALTIINTNLTRNVTFSSGGFPARYGNRLSSFMSIEPRDGNREHFEALFDFNMSGLELGIEGPITRKANYSLCYRRGFLGLLDKLSDIGDVIPDYHDYYARLVFEPTKNDKFSILNILAPKDYLLVPSTQTLFHNDLELWTGMAINGLNWRHLLGSAGFLRTTFSRNGVWNRVETKDELNYRTKDVSYLLSTELNYRINPRLVLEMGGQSGYWALEESAFVTAYRLPWGDSVPEVNASGDTTTIRSAAYIQAQYQPFRFLRVMPGLRYDYLQLNRQPVYSPRLGLSLPIFANTTLNFAYGHFYQAPSYFTMMVEPELKFKKAVHYIAGIEQLITSSLRFSVEGYYKGLSQLPVPASREPRADLDSVGTGSAKGIEFFLHQKLARKVYGRISYSYGFSERQDWQGIYPADYDQRNILTVIGGYTFTKDMELSVKFRYASGRPYTPYDTLQKRQYPGEPDRWYCPRATKINSAYYPAYHRLDLQWSRTDHFGSITLTSYINIQNIYDRRNVYNYVWDVKQGKLDTNYQFFRMFVGGFSVAF